MLNSNIKEVKNYEGLYWISKCGKIFNRFKELKTYLNNSGYKMITLIKDKHRKHFLIHRLVAISFLEEDILNLKNVNHIDGNKLNNDASNLEWCSQRDNILHAKKLGLNPYNYPTLGIKFGNSSKYRNVMWDDKRKKWKASLSINNKTCYQKRFNTEIDAALYINHLITSLNLNRPLNNIDII